MIKGLSFVRQVLFYQKLYNKGDFKACEARKSGTDAAEREQNKLFVMPSRKEEKTAMRD